MRNRLALAAAVTLLTSSAHVLAQSPTSTYTWTVPGTVNASGLNGTRFVSDLALMNPGAAPAIAILTLVPANGTSQSLQFLAPGQTLVVRNVLQQLWGASGAAATVVTSTSPLLIRARTYNTAASGTYGVALPVVADDRFLFPGDSADSLWIAQSSDGSTGYRTNVAVVFPDPAGGDATVTVYDATGAAVGSQAFSLSSGGFQQFAVGAFAGAVAVGRARMVVTRGRATAYAVVVDNMTGDSSLFGFDTLPAGGQDVLANGVARANGRNNTFFRTDARIYNPSATEASVAVAFHANQNANLSPQTATFTVQAGQIRDVVDVLDTLLSLPVGSAGALRFTSDGPVAILCRTSNVDPSGAKPGTFGAQQRPTPVLSFLSSADAGAVVTGIRQGTDFRTNVGFAAGAAGTNYSLTLNNAAGIAVGTASGSLGAWGWTQPNVQDLFPGVTVPADATLLVNVTAGSVDIFDSSIDNTSGDPVVTPIMPIPAAIPSAATIGPAGGSVQSSDGRLTLKIPAGALSAPTAVAIASVPSDAPNAVGPGYSISPAGISLAKSGLLVFTYSRFDVNGTAPGSLLPAFQSGASWYSMPGWSTDTAARTVVSSFSDVAPPALRAGRQTLAGKTPSVVVLVGTLSIKGPIVVPPGGNSETYSLQRLIPVPLNPTLSYVITLDPIVASAVSWSVDFGSITALPTSTPAATYISPACPPPHAAAEVTTTYHGESAHLVISIFPLLWTLSIDEDVNELCIDDHTVGYHAKDHIEHTFTIDRETGRVVPGAQEHDGATLVTAPVSCPLPGAECGCSLQVAKSPPGLSLGTPDGKVVMGYLELTAQYQHIGVPLILINCTGPAPCRSTNKQETPGAKDIMILPYGDIPYNGATSPPNEKASSPGQIVMDTFRVKPKDLSCP